MSAGAQRRESVSKIVLCLHRLRLKGILFQKDSPDNSGKKPGCTGAGSALQKCFSLKKIITMKGLSFIYFFLLLHAVQPGIANGARWKQPAGDPEYLHRAVKQVTDVIVHDVYSPPVASRTYAYISVAAYEAARFEDQSFLSLAPAALHPRSGTPDASTPAASCQRARRPLTAARRGGPGLRAHAALHPAEPRR